MANLTKELLKLYALGQLTATEVQGLAHAASQDGWGGDYNLAASLSRKTKWSAKNATRTVMLVAKKFALASSLSQYSVELDPVSGKRLDMFLPHEIYAYASKRGGLSRWCLPAEQLAGESQTHLGRLLSEWRDNEDVQYAGNITEVGILGFHMDGVDISSSKSVGKSKSVLVASLNVCSAEKASDRAIRFPLYVLRKSRCCTCGCSGYCTLQRIFEVIAWSCRSLMIGRTPSDNHLGDPFTEAQRACRLEPGSPLPAAALLQVRGDWESHINTFRLRTCRQEHFCWKCDATTSDGVHCFRHFEEDAAYINTTIDHKTYLERCAAENQQPSHLFRCPGLTIDHIMIDTMHAADLGAFGDCLGSLFYLEVSNKSWHRTNEAGLESLNRSLNRYYDLNKHKGLTRATPLSMSQIMSKSLGYPFLKAKATEARHLAEFAVWLAMKHMYGDESRRPFCFSDGGRMAGRTEEHLAALVAMCQGMERYERSLRSEPFDGETCKTAMLQFLASLDILNRLWRRGREEETGLPFVVRPKCHMLWHVVVHQIPRAGNPAESWCYRDESYVGDVKRICSKTRHPRTLEAMVLLKMRILQGLAGDL